MRTEFLYISVLGVASGPRMKLASCKSALTPPPTTPRWFNPPSHVSFYSCVFSPFSIAITSLGEERANLSAFRTCVCSVCACLDLSVSSSSWGLGRAAVCDCGTPWTFLLPFFFFFTLLTVLRR